VPPAVIGSPSYSGIPFIALPQRFPSMFENLKLELYFTTTKKEESMAAINCFIFSCIFWGE
jgi:hypothetical protein